MNHKLHLSDYQFPPIKARDWKKVLNLEESLLELLSQMLVWNPKKRLSGIECLASKYFDSLRC